MRVRVAATSANLGPGFDCLGVTLGLYNEFRFAPAEEQAFRVVSEAYPVEAQKMSADRRNLVQQAFAHLCRHIDAPIPTVSIEVDMGVPLGRGLGSSATAIVGGIAAANAWHGSPLSTPEWLQLAVELEGHPDNVVPAALGGCQLSVLTLNGLLTCPVAWHPAIVPVVAVPDFKLATSKARAALPVTVPHTDAVYNAARTGLLIRGLESGCGEWLIEALQDRLHQPYRAALIPGWQTVRQAALDLGAWGVVISGAGPSLLALVPAEQAEAIATAMQVAWEEHSTHATIYKPGIEPDGCVVV
ncbi:MAG: homoserine kinase [Gemmatimonadaceae bacterium]|nr:homoserine kinase [Gloeobacterales cyanobacterium ES-bin-141]